MAINVIITGYFRASSYTYTLKHKHKLKHNFFPEAVALLNSVTNLCISISCKLSLSLAAILLSQITRDIHLHPACTRLLYLSCALSGALDG